jgi:hypothetical protein
MKEQNLMCGIVMALNIVFGGSLGNITASQVLAIPDGQLKTDVRFSPSFTSLLYMHIITSTLCSVNPRATPQTKPFKYVSPPPPPRNTFLTIPLNRPAETQTTLAYATTQPSPLSSLANNVCSQNSSTRTCRCLIRGLVRPPLWQVPFLFPFI